MLLCCRHAVALCARGRADYCSQTRKTGETDEDAGIREPTLAAQNPATVTCPRPKTETTGFSLSATPCDPPPPTPARARPNPLPDLTFLVFAVEQDGADLPPSLRRPLLLDVPGAGPADAHHPGEGAEVKFGPAPGPPARVLTTNRLDSALHKATQILSSALHSLGYRSFFSCAASWCTSWCCMAVWRLCCTR